MKVRNQFRNQLNIVLLIVDLVCIFASYAVSLYIRLGSVFRAPQIHFILLIVQVAVYITICYARDIYQGIYQRGYFRELQKVVEVNLILAAVTFAVLFFAKSGQGVFQDRLHMVFRTEHPADLWQSCDHKKMGAAAVPAWERQPEAHGGHHARPCAGRH